MRMTYANEYHANENENELNRTIIAGPSFFGKTYLL